jgi:Fe-S-cluster containining protein
VDGFQVTREEYLRLKEYWESLPVEERERLGGKPRELPWPGAPEFSYTACRFRDPENGRCSVYPVRPLICRLFGHAEWLPCPIDRIPSPSPDARLMIEEYAREELRTIEEWDREIGD